MDNILDRIHKSALKFLVPLTIEETYKLIVHEAVKLTKTHQGSIFLEENGELKRVYASNSILNKIKIRKIGTTYKTFRSQKANVTNATVLEKAHPQFKKMNLKAIVSIPLINQRKSIGVLSVQSRKDKYFTDEQLNSLKIFGSLASLAIRKNQLYEETKMALEARDLFISMAAHELRTPITTISGYAQLLYSKFGEAETPESRWIKELTWETLRLSHLVNELLEVDRIKTGQFQYFFKECSLKEILQRAAADFKITHPEHSLLIKNTIKKNKDIIIGDFDKLLQMILNLLDNAAKFSPPSLSITLKLDSKPSCFTLIVQDKGKGVSKPELPIIFEKYYKGVDTRVEGMGLGLFLVKNIIREHHGEIKISSKLNKGTTIKIKLPKLGQI